MSSSTYKPLTGREIREILILRLTNEVNRLPYMREGNSFHNVNVQLGIVITAYPEDVPTPNLDLEFKVPAELDNIEKSLNQVEKAEDLALAIEKLEKHKQETENLLNQALEARATMIFEHEAEIEFDGNVPDKTRMENNIPITVEKVEKGKRVESKIAAIEFGKMVK